MYPHPEQYGKQLDIEEAIEEANLALKSQSKKATDDNHNGKGI